MSNGVEDGQIKRFRSDGRPSTGAEQPLQHRLALGHVDVPKSGWIAVRRSVSSAMSSSPMNSTSMSLNRQAWIYVAPTPPQISPDPMRENLCEGASGIFADNGARLGMQHPMDTCVLVTRSKSERLYNSQTEFVLGHSIVAGVQYGSQDRATQETDEQKVIEVTRLESGAGCP